MIRVGVRAARPEDAAALAEVHVRAWQEGYRGLMPQEYLDGLDVAERAEQWRRRLEAPEGGRGLLVGVLDGEPAGFAGHGKELDGAEPSTGQLYGINVHPRCWGRGVGGAMLAAVEASLAAQGYRSAVLWVVPGNARARAVYERRGWAPDGAERTEETFGVTVPVMRYRLPLRPPAAAR